MSTPDLRSLADRLAIEALVARYCHAVSDRDDDAWFATWAEDAEWLVMGQTVNGREKILAHYQAIVSGLALVVQTAANPVIEVAGDEATGRWLMHEVLKTKDGHAAVNHGLYLDRYRRERDGAWRFARREFRSRYLGPPDLSASPRSAR